MALLAEGLRANTMIKELILKSCSLTDEHFLPIAYALSGTIGGGAYGSGNYAMIQNLDLRCNSLTHISLNHLVRAVLNRGILQNLCLSHNHKLLERGRQLGALLWPFASRSGHHQFDARRFGHVWLTGGGGGVHLASPLESSTFLRSILLDVAHQDVIRQYLQSLPLIKSLTTLTIFDHVTNADSDEDDVDNIA